MINKELELKRDFIILQASNYHYDLGIEHEKERIIEELNKMKGEIMSLPNRDDTIHARILMPDGGGVNKFVVTNKIDDLITLLSAKTSSKVEGAK